MIPTLAGDATGGLGCAVGVHLGTPLRNPLAISRGSFPPRDGDSGTCDVEQTRRFARPQPGQRF